MAGPDWLLRYADSPNLIMKHDDVTLRYYETESRQLVGLVGGVPDAITYEALAGDQTGPTSKSAARLDSQLAGQVLLILVILAGNLVYLSRRGTRRER